MKFPFVLFVTVALQLGSANAWGQVIFQSELTTDEGLRVIEGSDNAFTFGYDYNRHDGIPEAPNSDILGGEAFQGLKLEANLSQAMASEIAVVTDGLDLADRYAVQVDAWLNYNIPDGDQGTTEFAGIAIGHDGVTPGRSGGAFVFDTDGNSSFDYRLYRDKTFVDLASDAYEVNSLDNATEPFSSAFSAVDVATVVPAQFIAGTTPAGTAGFRWTVVEAVVDNHATGIGTTPDRGVATFSITDAASQSKVTIGQIDNSAGGPVVDMSGDVGLLFLDILSSLSLNPELSFGVFDNLIITQLEPAFSPLDCNQDGMTDPTDLTCVTAESLTALLDELNLLRGDFNGDGSVSFADFTRLSRNFGSNVDSYVDGDADLNGKVGFPDFTVLNSNFGKTRPAAAVPEPDGYLLLCSLLTLLPWRSFRPGQDAG